jgi:hypothetical protein
VQYFNSDVDWTLPTWSQITTQGAVGVTGRWSSSMFTSHRERLSGYLVVPRTGLYRFYLSADDWAQLSLSPTMFLSDAVVIATATASVPSRWYWQSPGTQISASIQLNASQPYYFQVLHNQTTGLGHVRVAIRHVGFAGCAVRPMPGSAAACQRRTVCALGKMSLLCE